MISYDIMYIQQGDKLSQVEALGAQVQYIIKVSEVNSFVSKQTCADTKGH